MKKYILVCNSAKSKVIGGGCCYDKGGDELLNEIQEEIEKRGLCKSVLVKGSACMSNCKEGISVRTLPDRNIHSRVQESGIDLLLEAVMTPVPKSKV